MSLVSFQNKTYLRYKQYWFLWEPAWDSFRPIQSLLWNGTSFEEENVYCQDPSSELYGYGDEKMKQVCEALREQYASATPKPVDWICIGKDCVWMNDRFACLSPCAPRDKQSWKRMIRGKHRTCRRAPRGKKLTRRAL